MSELPPPPAYPPPPPSYPPPHVEPTLLASSGPEPPRPSRAPVIALAVIGVAIVAALAVAVPLLVNDEPVSKDLAAVKSYDHLSNAHTLSDVDYPQSPPVGGPHNPVWLDCGVYDDPVRDENAVHDLEHGTVWISYQPGLGGDDVALLEKALPQNGILTPYPGLTAPVVVTVWGKQLALNGADDPRLKLFITTYGGGVTAPEPMASCAGGSRDPSSDDGGSSGTDV